MARLQAIQDAQRAFGPIWAVTEDGTRTLITDTLQLSPAEDRQWQDRFAEIRAKALPGIEAAVDALSEEVAVLRMTNDDIGQHAAIVLTTAQGAMRHFEAEEPLRQSIESMHAAVQGMWLAVESRT